MDFLDPQKRQKHRTRLIIGYILFGLALVIGTIILVLAVYGYGINTRTGSIVQNGLIFVESQPGGADISLDGQDRHAKTAARLVLPAQNYNLVLSRDGYQNWSRTFLLKQQSIVRLSYPLLFPVKPAITPIKTYSSQPSLFSASPDRRWLLAGGSVAANGQAIIDEYDTKNISTPPQSLKLPSGILLKPGSQAGRLTAIEWSADNNYLLARHDYSGHSEFIMLDRRLPAKSLNLNKLFKISPSSVSLRDKKADQLYLYTAKGGTLQVGFTNPVALAKPFLKSANSFKAVGPNLIIYSTEISKPSPRLAVRIWDNGQSYNLASLPAGSQDLLNGGFYQGHWYYAVTADSINQLNIYKDPLSDLKKSASAKTAAFDTLRIIKPDSLTMPPNAHFIVAEAGATLAAYDFETGYSYYYNLPKTPPQALVWADDNHLIGNNNGKLLVTDYDGANQVLVSPASFSGGGFFSPDYHQLLTLAPSAKGKTVFESINMLAVQNH